MALKVPLALCLLLVISCAGMMGKEILGANMIGRELLSNPYLRHWLRTDPAKDKCVDPGTLIADPDNCHNYYVCLGAGTILTDPQTCPEDEYACFLPTDDADPTGLGSCQAVDGTDVAKCETACAGEDGGSCTYECPADGGNTVVASKDCKKFKLCFTAPTAGPPPSSSPLKSDYLMEPPTRGEVEFPCPDETPYFNGEECTTDSSQCCSCQPATCVTALDKVPDPLDCHAYYLCVDIDDDTILDQTGPTTCPNGGSFVDTDCDDATTECTNPCEGGGGSSPSIDDTTPAGEVTTPGGESTTDSSGATTGDTSSDSSGATTAVLTTTDDGCTEPADFTCPAKGYYAYCETCVQSYLKCDSAGSTPSLGSCTGDLVFNPAPEYPFCVRPENCPFSQ